MLYTIGRILEIAESIIWIIYKNRICNFEMIKLKFGGKYLIDILYHI
jgi:hypothetical protein